MKTKNSSTPVITDSSPDLVKVESYPYQTTNFNARHGMPSKVANLHGAQLPRQQPNSAPTNLFSGVQAFQQNSASPSFSSQSSFPSHLSANTYNTFPPQSFDHVNNFDYAPEYLSKSPFSAWTSMYSTEPLTIDPAVISQPLSPPEVELAIQSMQHQPSILPPLPPELPTQPLSQTNGFNSDGVSQVFHARTSLSSRAIGIEVNEKKIKFEDKDSSIQNTYSQGQSTTAQRARNPLENKPVRKKQKINNVDLQEISHRSSQPLRTNSGTADDTAITPIFSNEFTEQEVTFKDKDNLIKNTSKVRKTSDIRAKQNRIAQRKFRENRKKYIASLEQKNMASEQLIEKLKIELAQLKANLTILISQSNQNAVLTKS